MYHIIETNISGAEIELMNGTKVPRFWTDGKPFTFLSRYSLNTSRLMFSLFYNFLKQDISLLAFPINLVFANNEECL